MQAVVGADCAYKHATIPAEGPSLGFSEAPDQVRWQVNLPHLHRRATERRSRDTAQWVAAHVSPERRHQPPGGSSLPRQRRKVRKSLVSRYYKLFSGRAAIGSFLHECPRDWSRASAGGATAGSGSRVITFSPSAGPGLPRLGGFGRGSGRIAIGNGRGCRLSG